MSKEICQYTINGELIKIWTSMKEIEQSLNINHSKVSEVTRGKRKQTGGFIWRLKGDKFNRYELPNKILGTHQQGKKATKQKTTEQFKNDIFRLVGDEYSLVSSYTNANTKVTMIHNLCGNTYTVKPGNFVNNGRRCPICSHINGGIKHRSISKYIDNLFKNKFKNKYELVSDLPKTSKDFIKFKCLECGLVSTVGAYQAKSSKFACACMKGKRISNSKTKSTEYFKVQVYNLEQNRYSVIGEYVSGKTPICMINNTSGTMFYVKPTNFLLGQRERELHQPKGEREIEYILKSHHIDYKYQYKLYVANRMLRPDFYLPDYNTFIEFDGQQHHEAVSLFGGEEGLRKTQERDALKNAYAYEHGIKMIRIPYCYLNHIKEFLDPFFAKNKPIKKQ